MNREELNKKRVRLSSEPGIVDLRTGKLHSEAIVRTREEKYFTDFTEEKEDEN